MLDHVQIAMPAGGEGEARAFYSELIGLPEIPKPETLAGNGGCWFEAGSLQLHLGIDPDFRPAKKAHVALSVANLAALRERVVGAGHPVYGDDALEGRARFFSEDPFGNRIEFLEART